MKLTTFEKAERLRSEILEMDSAIRRIKEATIFRAELPKSTSSSFQESIAIEVIHEPELFKKLQDTALKDHRAFRSKGSQLLNP